MSATLSPPAPTRSGSRPPRTELIRQFESVVGPEGVVSQREQLRTYECDGLTSYRVVPDLVVLPETTEQVSRIVQICHRGGVPFVARGSGTGLSGGALPVESGVLIVLARMRRILEVDVPNQRVVAEPGVINLSVTAAVASEGYYYAPDPSSQLVCSIGGNVAENSGGAHCLKYGFTTNHVLALEVVLPDGEVVHLGSATLDPPGYDLVGAFVGSEGTLGISTAVTPASCGAPKPSRCCWVPSRAPTRPARQSPGSSPPASFQPRWK
jgi:glycolate oxidase